MCFLDCAFFHKRNLTTQVGAHDGDWEHVTMRLSADGSKVLGVYYSAHRCCLLQPLILDTEVCLICHTSHAVGVS